MNDFNLKEKAKDLIYLIIKKQQVIKKSFVVALPLLVLSDLFIKFLSTSFLQIVEYFSTRRLIAEGYPPLPKNCCASYPSFGLPLVYAKSTLVFHKYDLSFINFIIDYLFFFVILLVFQYFLKKYDLRKKK